MTGSTERVGRRAQGDDGAALVEFALVAVLLFSLIFGIIHYGLILSFKQDVTRAAAEGARAGAVAFPAANAELDAETAVDEAVKAFGGDRWAADGCNREGMTCEVEPPAPCLNAPAFECVTVRLYYNYDGEPDSANPLDPDYCGVPSSFDQKLYGEIPLIGGLSEPDCIRATSVARTNA